MTRQTARSVDAALSGTYASPSGVPATNPGPALTAYAEDYRRIVTGDDL